MHCDDEENFGDDHEDFGHGMHLINKRFIIEMFILIIHPVPFHDDYWVIVARQKQVVYLYSEIILVFMSLRVYFLVRCILNYSDFLNAYSKKVCRSYGFETGVFYTIKCLMVTSPEKTVLLIFFSTIIFFAYIIRVIELPYYRATGDP